MKISKTVLWLSVIDALLVLIASASGIFLKSVYARETPSWAVQGIAQDIVNLVAVMALCIAAYFVNNGSLKAFLVWSGVLLYLLYAYIIYAFDVHFNSLFLVDLHPNLWRPQTWGLTHQLFVHEGTDIL